MFVSTDVLESKFYIYTNRRTTFYILIEKKSAKTKQLIINFIFNKSLKNRPYPDLTTEHNKELQFAIRSRQFGDLVLRKKDLFNLILRPFWLENKCTFFKKFRYLGII